MNNNYPILESLVVLQQLQGYVSHVRHLQQSVSKPVPGVSSILFWQDS